VGVKAAGLPSAPPPEGRRGNGVIPGFRGGLRCRWLWPLGLSSLPREGKGSACGPPLGLWSAALRSSSTARARAPEKEWRRAVHCAVPPPFGEKRGKGRGLAVGGVHANPSLALGETGSALYSEGAATV